MNNQELSETYPPTFWRWFFASRYQRFKDLRKCQTKIFEAHNPFNDPPTNEMTINFETGKCTDSENIDYWITEYLFMLEEWEPSKAEMTLETEHKRWLKERKEQQKNQLFQRDLEHYQWKMKKNGSLKVVTTFDVRLDSVIEKFNIKHQEWLRTFQGEIRGLKSGDLVSKPFTFDPQQTHTAKKFSEAVWEKDFFQVRFGNSERVRQFWTFLDEFFQPRIVREYNHYGFIEFREEPFYLAGNVLVRFPEEEGQQLQLISKTDEAFRVVENRYVRPPENAFHLPHLDLGVSNPNTNRFRQATSALFSDEHFERKIGEVEDHLCSMIGADHEFRRWGQLILGYVFHFLFFDEIYELFQHDIYLYLYGEANVGKGELAKRILDFFGISQEDSENNPPARTVDQELELKSQIPLWIDEFVPELNGKQNKIDDQHWNSWFELKIRQTNMRDKRESWKKERKQVLTVPLFCSNYKPQSDHLLSRCLILEYRRSVRGHERHVRWLKQNKKLLQLLMLSYMQHYKTVDRNVFSWNLDMLRTILRDAVREELDNRIEDVILQDRQITQFAILFTVYHWLFADYREKIGEIYAKRQNLSEEDDIAFQQEQLESLRMEILDLTDSELYRFVKDQIISSAVAAARYDPLTEYIETIGTLIQREKITEKHFNWMKDGTLKIYAKGVWDLYEAEKRGTDSMVRKEVVQRKLKELSELAGDGSIKTVSWTVKGDKAGLNGEKVTKRGFYIPHAVERELLRRAFQWEKFKPSNAKSFSDMDKTGTEEEVPF